MKYSWELLAKRNQPMPDGLNQSEQLAFQTLALLTARYKIKAISDEQSVQERKKIDMAYDRTIMAEKYNRWIVELRKRIEIAHARYKKERTIEAADLLSDVIDGFIREIKND